MSHTRPHIDAHLDTAALAKLQAWLQAECADMVLGVTTSHKELTVRCRKVDIVPFLKKLRDDKKTQFKQLMDVCGVDYLGDESRAEERFDVVYHLLSLTHNLRLRVKVWVADGDSVPSVVPVFSAANWFERECYDLFGIPFENHPDLRRILTDYDFDGHPMRKDFPLEGKVEVYYDENEKRVAYKPVDLPQEFRKFDTVSPWQGITTNSHLADEDNAFDAQEFAEGAK